MIEPSWLNSIGRFFAPIFSSAIAGYVALWMRQNIYRFKYGRQADIDLFQKFVEEVGPEKCALMLLGKECSEDVNYKQLCTVFSTALLEKYPVERNIYYHDCHLNRKFLQLLNFSAEIAEINEVNSVAIDGIKDLEGKGASETLEVEGKSREKIGDFEKSANDISGALIEFVDLAHQRLRV